MPKKVIKKILTSRSQWNINFLKYFFFFNVLDNNTNNIFSFLFLRCFYQNLSLFAFLKKKTQFLTPCFYIKNFFVYSRGHWEYILKKWNIYVQRGRRLKIGGDGDHFRCSKSPERNIANLTSYSAPRQLYESIFKNSTGCY